MYTDLDFHIDSFSFLVPFNTKITKNEFTDLIKQAYDIKNPCVYEGFNLIKNSKLLTIENRRNDIFKTFEV